MRRAGRIAVLGALLLGVAGGVYALHAVFADERAEAEAAVAARRRALDAFAARAFEDALARRLAAARPAIDAAEADPLAPTAGLYRWRGTRRRVPTAEAPVVGPIGRAGERYRALRDPAFVEAGAADDVEAPLRAARAAVVEAVAGGEPGAIADATRRFLAARGAHMRSPVDDLPRVLAVLGLVDAAVELHPALLRAVLLDGVGEGPQRVEGVQRALLRHRGLFTTADFELFAAEVVRLSRRGQVPRAAFVAASSVPAAPPIEGEVRAPSLFDEGRWYVEPGETVDGVRVDPLAEAAAVEATMRAGGLLGDGERLMVDPAAPVPVAVASPAWVEAPARARATWRLKVALIWVCAALAIAAAGLWLLDARRRRRYVELKSDFIAAVSHELRTPLAAIRLMAETLERRLVDVPRARDYPARIVREADHLGFLVENLLSYSRIDKGRWVARRQPVRLADVVSRVREGMETAFAGVAIEWRLAGLDGVVLDADPALLELLSTNLIRNAIQHHGGAVVRLSVEAEAVDGLCAVRVSDDGPGIAPGVAAQIFEPFFRAPTAQGRGSGLGLALCRRIAALHRGALELVRTGPGGTTFEARLPLATPGAS